MRSIGPPSRLHAASRREEERAGRLLRMIALTGALVHAGMGLCLLSLGVRWLALGNIVSVLVFVGTYALVLRGGVVLPSVLMLAEVVVHQTLAVSAMGWSYGFQYWLIPAAAAAFVMPGTRFRLGVAAMLVAFTTYGALFALLGQSGTRVVPGAVGWGLTIINHLGAPIVTCLIAYMLARVANDMEEKLEAEYRRSEDLLHAILPIAVAERLKDGRTTSEGVDPATVLFADLVGFTAWAEHTSPENVVKRLDTVFGAFDEMADRLGLEKIKTIGDAYMVAGGLPGTHVDHVAATARLALEMRSYLEAHAGDLSMRIGIHTGPVVAGVIGKRKFAFDLWGDTVNIAARMESHGQPNRIHVSEAVAAALGEGFVLEERGSIEVKGKGLMRTFWLEGIRPG
jgi:class 3 adenylate cyclase